MAGKHRNFVVNDPLPSAFVDALQSYISTYVSPLFVVVPASATSVSVFAGTPSDQLVAIGIGSGLRFNTATVTATVSGAAGSKDVFVTAPVLNTAAEDAGTFDYSFSLVVLTSGTTPGGGVLYRKVATVAWSGSAITDIQQQVPLVTSSMLSGNLFQSTLLGLSRSLGGPVVSPSQLMGEILGLSVPTAKRRGSHYQTGSRHVTSTSLAAVPTDPDIVTNITVPFGGVLWVAYEAFLTERSGFGPTATAALFIGGNQAKGMASGSPAASAEALASGTIALTSGQTKRIALTPDGFSVSNVITASTPNPATVERGTGLQWVPYYFTSGGTVDVEVRYKVASGVVPVDVDTSTLLVKVESFEATTF